MSVFRKILCQNYMDDPQNGHNKLGREDRYLLIYPLVKNYYLVRYKLLILKLQKTFAIYLALRKSFLYSSNFQRSIFLFLSKTLQNYALLFQWRLGLSLVVIPIAQFHLIKSDLSGLCQCKSCLQHVRAQPAFTCSKSTIETLEQGVKYAQS